MAIVDDAGMPVLVVTRGASLVDAPCGHVHLCVMVEQVGHLFRPMRFILDPDEPLQILTEA
jgi:hypothetical protein